MDGRNAFAGSRAKMERSTLTVKKKWPFLRGWDKGKSVDLTHTDIATNRKRRPGKS